MLIAAVMEHADEKHTAEIFSNCIKGNPIALVNTGEIIRCYKEPAKMAHPIDVPLKEK